MGNTKKILTLCAAAALAAACTSADERDLRANAQAYLDATANYRLDEALPYATPETARTIAAMHVLMQMADTAYIRSNQPAEVTLQRVERTSDTSALVTYRKRTPIKEQTSTLEMRRRSDGWRAHVVLNAALPQEQAHSQASAE